MSDVFWLYKIAAAAFSPLPLAFVGTLVAALLFWRRRRRLALGVAAMSFVGLWLASTPWFAWSLATSLESQHPLLPVESTPTADAVLVLGGAVAAAQPPLQPHLGLLSAADRVWHAGALYRAGKARWVLLTGGNQPGQQDRPSEAEAMREMLRVVGVPDDAMRLESRSRNTRENASFSVAMVKEVRARRVLLVTSALHMPRALTTFETAFSGTGVVFLPAATDAEALGDVPDPAAQWLPDANSLAWSSRAIKEYLGLLHVSVVKVMS